MYSTNTTRQNNLKNYIISQLGDDYIDAGQGELRYKCHFCEEEGRKFEDYKLYVHYSGKKAGLYWCHRCEAKGRIKLDETLASESTTEAYDIIEQYVNGLNKSEDDEEESDYFLLPKSVPEPYTIAWGYLMNRRITPDLISYYDIRVASTSDTPRLFGRIVIPNRVYGKIWTDVYVARTFIDDPVRYKNPRSSRAHELVFNLHRIENNLPRIIINEGAINSIIAGKDSVATFGKHVSYYQLKSILEKKPQSIYVSLDTDARDKAEKLCSRIISHTDIPTYLVELPDNKDASDLGQEAYLDYVGSAKQYTKSSIYVISKAISELGAD